MPDGRFLYAASSQPVQAKPERIPVILKLLVMVVGVSAALTAGKPKNAPGPNDQLHVLERWI